MSEKDEFKSLPLHYVCIDIPKEQRVSATKEMIACGENIIEQDKNGNMPLWIATMNSHRGTELVNLLLTHGANPDQKNNHGISPVEISPELFGNAI